MKFGFRKLPEGLELVPFSRRVFETLARHTSFPWPIMQAQSKRVGADPAQLSPTDLAKLAPLLAEAVGRFTSPEARDDVQRELERLAA
jgi:hypothetical protein